MVSDAAFRIVDNVDSSKSVVFELSGLSTGVTRTLAAPNASTTLVGTDAAQTLLNKTLSASVGGDPPLLVRAAGAGASTLARMVDSTSAELLRFVAAPENLFIGRMSGNTSMTGLRNLGIGMSTLVATTSGGGNVALGSLALAANTTGGSNTAVGADALAANTTGTSNTALGRWTLSRNTIGERNVAVGHLALNQNTSGVENIAIGVSALSKNTTGLGNIAMGTVTLSANQTGNLNIAIGSGALSNNLASNNTAVGSGALSYNTIGTGNVAVGNDSLNRNDAGNNNVAVGDNALGDSDLYDNNTAVGFNALLKNQAPGNTAVGSRAMAANFTGQANTAVGTGSLAANVSGGSNTAVGGAALGKSTGSSNTAVGAGALNANTTGNFNTALGGSALNALATFTNVTGLGYNAQATGSNQVILGDGNATTYVKGGAVNSISDVRDKADVRDTVLGLSFIAALRPVDFRYDLRSDYRPERPESEDRDALVAWLEAGKLANLRADGSRKRTRFHHGLIAQEVREVMARTGVDFGGFQDHTVGGGDEQLTLGYDEFIGPMIKAIQELAIENAALKRQLCDGLASFGARLAALED